MTNNNIAIRASIIHFLNKDEYEFFEDGLLVVMNGFVKEIGPSEVLLEKWQCVIPIEDESDKLLMPGFVDGHIHAV